MKKKPWIRLLAFCLAMILCLGDMGFVAKAEETTGVVENEETPTLKTVNDNSDDTAMQLAKLLVGDSNDNMEVKSAKLIAGEATQFGSFEGAYKTVGFNEGIVLSTGTVNPHEKSMFEQGYKQLASTDVTHDYANGSSVAIDKEKEKDKLAGFTIEEYDYFDPAILEFTVVPKTDSLSFQYSVASDEYPEFIHDYFDQFVLTVDGINYAWIPETNEPVTIGKVNHEKNNKYYRGVVADTDDGNAISLNHFVYDGITKVFSVDAPVTKGKETVIRLAIADYKDAILDSAVFVKAGSVQDKQPLYGLIDFSYVDLEKRELYIRRKGGYNGAVSADIVYTDENKNPISQKTIEFPDGAYINITKAPDNAKYAYLANPTGAVKVSDEIVDLTNWISPTELKKLKTKVTGYVYEMQGDKKVPVENAEVIYQALETNEETKTNSYKPKNNKKTDKDGKYMIHNIPYGKYNVVVKANGKETTAYMEFTVADINPSGAKATDIILDKNISIENKSSLPVVIGNLENVAENANDIKVSVDTKKVQASDNKDIIVSGANKISQEDVLDSYVLDIKLNADDKNQTELKKPILVTVQIPEDKWKAKNDYFLYHVHTTENGGKEVEILYDLDNDPHTITVEIDKLSEFALVVGDNKKLGKYETAESKNAEIVLATVEQKAGEQANKVVEKLGGTGLDSTPDEKPSEGTKPDNGNNGNQGNNNTPSDGNQGNNNNHNNSNSSNSSSSINNGNQETITEQLRQKVFEGITVIDKKTLYKGDEDVIELTTAKGNYLVAKYSSNNSKIVSVDKDGNIKAKAVGSTTIITEIKKEGISKKYETKVTVKKPAIKIVAGKSKVKKGQTATFKAQVYGSNAKAKWSVSNKKLATIDSKTGKLKARATGTVTVYAKAGSLKKSYKVKIVK